MKSSAYWYSGGSFVLLFKEEFHQVYIADVQSLGDVRGAPAP